MLSDKDFDQGKQLWNLVANDLGIEVKQTSTKRSAMKKKTFLYLIPYILVTCPRLPLLCTLVVEE